MHSDPPHAEHDAAAMAAVGSARAGEPNAAARMRERLVGIAEPVVAAHRCELVTFEYRREPIGWVVRLFVERLGHDPRMPNGVTLEECALISRDLGTALDVADAIPHAYQLEVSSPGLERPIEKLTDWQRFAGLRAKLVVREPVAPWPGHKAFRGEILGATGDAVRIVDDDLGEVTVPFTAIGRAHLVYEATAKPKPGGKKKGARPAREKNGGAAKTAPAAIVSAADDASAESMNTARTSEDNQTVRKS
jgi:ribosome maturation factor RimP